MTRSAVEPAPFARVVPEPKSKTFVGACPSPFPLPADIDDPVDVDHYFPPMLSARSIDAAVMFARP